MAADTTAARPLYRRRSSHWLPSTLSRRRGPLLRRRGCSCSTFASRQSATSSRAVFFHLIIRLTRPLLLAVAHLVQVVFSIMATVVLWQTHFPLLFGLRSVHLGPLPFFLLPPPVVPYFTKTNTRRGGFGVKFFGAPRGSSMQRQSSSNLLHIVLINLSADFLAADLSLLSPIRPITISPAFIAPWLFCSCVRFHASPDERGRRNVFCKYLSQSREFVLSATFVEQSSNKRAQSSIEL